MYIVVAVVFVFIVCLVLAQWRRWRNRRTVPAARLWDFVTVDGRTKAPITEIPAEIVSGAALGATALQAESDTLATVLARGSDANQAEITNAKSVQAVGSGGPDYDIMVASGFGTPGANTVYYWQEEPFAGGPHYRDTTGKYFIWRMVGGIDDEWYIADADVGELYRSYDDVERPDLVTTWTVAFGAEPTGGVEPGAEIISATLTPDGVKDADDNEIHAFRYKTQQYAVGNVSGEVTLDALNGTVQTLVVTDDIWDISINNLAGNVVMLHIDNTAEKSIIIMSIDYISGEIPAGPGTFAVYVYAVNGLIYAAIGEHFEAV